MKDSDEYIEMLEILNSNFIVHNLYHSNHKLHPVTYAIDAGDNQHLYDNVLTAKEDIKSEQCLDYIFEVFIDKNDKENKMKVNNTTNINITKNVIVILLILIIIIYLEKTSSR